MKKLIAIILTLIMIFTLAACGKEEKKNNKIVIEEPKGWYTEGEVNITEEQVDYVLSKEFTTFLFFSLAVKSIAK